MRRLFVITALLIDFVFRFGILSVGEASLDAPFPAGGAGKGLLALSLIIIVPVLVALLFLIRFIYKQTIAKKLKTTVIEDYRKEAEGLEKAGSFVSAARVYEKKLKDYRKASALYEKGGDYRQAALLYDALGMTDKAKEMYSKAGSFDDAAEVAMLEGEFDEAATLYDKAGKKIDVAKVMEQAGKTMYAVKAYREAGEYKKAAMLLKQEGMFSEAAEMLQIHLFEKKPDGSTREDFYLYATLLEQTEQPQKAMDVFREIASVFPAFKDVNKRLQSLALSLQPPFEEEEMPAGNTALRGFIRNGKIEAKLGLKLWVQMLKGLQEAYKNGLPYGLLSPDNIAVDARNNISFLKRRQSLPYAPPEIVRGIAPDESADIYSAGVILYEMLTGSREGIGSASVADLVEDVPDWLDEIVIRCLRKVREDRYQSITDIFSDLKTLSKGRTDSGNPPE